MNNKITSFFILLLSFCVFIAGHAQAQQNKLAPIEVEPIVTDFQHFYEDITRASLARLYWRLNAMNLNNEEHLDMFMFITECEIYKDYYYNEFEWINVRTKTRKFLEEESPGFTVRYKFVQPLRLKEYDISSGLFEIHEDFAINDISKFEILATDENQKHCGSFYKDIQHYPRGAIVTMSQPFELTSIPMNPERAQKFINEKLAQFENLHDGSKSKEALYRYRDAYLVMKIRFFDYRGIGYSSWARGFPLAKMNAVLEGYEIYADRSHTDLLYFENFLRREDAMPTNERLKKQYKELIRKRQEYRIE